MAASATAPPPKFGSKLSAPVALRAPCAKSLNHPPRYLSSKLNPKPLTPSGPTWGARSRPEADFLRDKIYELRVGFNGMNYRMLYFFHGNIAAVVSHGIVKEAKVPPKEIDKAIERMVKFEH